MFGMNGFHVSARGAIQGHHGPFVQEHDENVQKFSKRVEKHGGKTRNCSLQAISPFSTVLSKDLYIVLQTHKNQGPYSPTILQNILSLGLQIFPYLAAFECNTTSDWLNRMV